MTRLPRTRDIWCVNHIDRANGPVVEQFTTHQAATNRQTHLGGPTKAVLFLGTVLIDDNANEEAA